jgi:hypothetical protein
MLVETLTGWSSLLHQPPAAITPACCRSATFLQPENGSASSVWVGTNSDIPYMSVLDESGANTGMQKGLIRHSNIATTMNNCSRAAIRAMQEANSKIVQMVLPKTNHLCLVWGFVGLSFEGSP